MEKQKKPKSKILFILLFILIIVFLINTSAVFFTAGLPSAVNKIFNSITTFVSNTFLSIPRTPIPITPKPILGTKCEEVLINSLDGELVKMEICKITNTNTHECEDIYDCKGVIQPLPPNVPPIKGVPEKKPPLLPIPLIGSECAEYDDEFGNPVRFCSPTVNPGAIRHCYSAADCNKKYKLCYSVLGGERVCGEREGIGPDECKINKDCEKYPLPIKPPNSI